MVSWCGGVWLAFSCCSSREHAEAIAFYRAGGTERELVTSRLQALLSSRSVLIWWQRNLEAFQLSYQCVVNADPHRFHRPLVCFQTSTCLLPNLDGTHFKAPRVGVILCANLTVPAIILVGL